MYHYLNTAKTTKKMHLLKELVKPKKYFYIIRPLLACRWIDEKKFNVAMEQIHEIGKMIA